MAQDRMIQIDRAPGETLAIFDPTPKLVNFNDTVTWRNNDPTEAHWPAPVPASGGQFDPSGWLPSQILAGGTNFQALTFGSANTSVDQTIQYVCANHQNEKGTIIVTSKPVPPEPADDADDDTDT